MEISPEKKKLSVALPKLAGKE